MERYFENRLKKYRWSEEMDPVKIIVKNKKTRRYQGLYYYKKSTIIIFERDLFMDMFKTVLHECAHHIEFRHAKGFIRYRGICHGRNFWKILKHLQENVSLKEILMGLWPYPPVRDGWVWNNQEKTALIYQKRRW